MFEVGRRNVRIRGEKRYSLKNCLFNIDDTRKPDNEISILYWIQSLHCWFIDMEMIIGLNSQINLMRNEREIEYDVNMC